MTPETPTEKPAGVGIFLIHQETGKFWISLRKNTSSYQGYWSIPGGSMEPGETPKQAAVRETREETGLEIAEEDLTLLYQGEFLHQTLNIPYGTFQFAVETEEVPQNKEPDKHGDWMLVSWEEAKTLLLFDAVLEVVKTKTP